MKSHNGIVLCTLCEDFRDLDLLLLRYPPKFHHKSYTALCESANSGCHLCQAFVQCQGLEPSFDRYIATDLTQICCQPQDDIGGSCSFILSQKQLIRWRRGFHVMVELLAKPDDPMAKLIKGRPIDERSGSESSFWRIRRWMKTCKEDHIVCTLPKNQILPTRVIDVGSDPHPRDPFLLTTNGRTGEWATLSHCWGGRSPISTTLATLEERQKRLSIKELPSTYVDDIIITKRLGFQYLWIDSLCIVQDSREDWEFETAKMQEIYKGGSINIAASAAKNDQDGIFKSADRLRQSITLPCFSDIHNIKGKISFRLTAANSQKALCDEPLHRRAWVFQESILAPRRLDFASKQLLWNCRGASFSEGFPEKRIQGDPLRIAGKALFDRPAGTCHPQPDLKWDKRPMMPMCFWYLSLMLYSSRSITFHADLLPAIAGIARKIQEKTCFSYKSGLWLEDFHRGLLWQSSGTVTRPRNTSTPTWSWASTYHPWRQGPRRLPLDTYIPEFNAEILEVKVTNHHNNCFTKVASASLKLQSKYRYVNQWSSPPIYNLSNEMALHKKWLPKTTTHHQHPQAVPSRRLLCTLDERPTNVQKCHLELVQKKVICLQIAKFHHSSLYPGHSKSGMEEEEDLAAAATLYGLLLEPRRIPGEYRRIGIAEIPEDEGMAEGWDSIVVDVV